MIGGCDELVTKQISDLLGRRATSIEPGGKGMAQPVRAKPAVKTAAAISAIHSCSNRPR